MTHAFAFDFARQAWHDLWQADGSDPWAIGRLTFVPFDRLGVLHERPDIEAHWQARRAEHRFVEHRWNPIAAWAVGDGHLLAADVRLALEHRGETEWRALTLTVVLEAETAGTTPPALRHLGEAVPAALLGVLAAYEREARQ